MLISHDLLLGFKKQVLKWGGRLLGVVEMSEKLA